MELTKAYQLPVEEAAQFMIAGNAIFTIKSKKTGQHRTFKIIPPGKYKTRFFVHVLVKADKYALLGHVNWRYMFEEVSIAGKEEHPSEKNKKRRYIIDKIIVAELLKNFRWFWQRRNMGAEYLNQYVSFYHMGYCGRCRRRLTHPKSIKQGYGPWCINKVKEK